MVLVDGIHTILYTEWVRAYLLEGRGKLMRKCGMAGLDVNLERIAFIRKIMIGHYYFSHASELSEIKPVREGQPRQASQQDL